MPRRSALVRLRVYLFGHIRIECESGPIRLSTHKIESLFAYLILHPGPQAREKLASLFWGDVTDDQARHSVRSALLTLRKALGEQILIADTVTVQLNPRYPIWVDVREFQQTISPNPESAVELYQGDLLSDFYDEWIVSIREQQRQLYLDTLLKLAQQARAQSQYLRAVEFAQKILASDPANEKAFQQTVFCYAAMGNRTVALQQYSQCKRALREELAVEPSRETQALYQWLVQGPTPSREAQITNLPIPLTSFIGREREMTQVKQLLARTRLVTLIGAGGSGKTRLAIQIATDQIDAYKDGVWLVDFAPLTDQALVPHSVAKTLGVRELSSESISTTLCNYLRPRALLLILDNCEHLVDACGHLALSLLSTAPQLKILATSREALRVSGETIWHVPTLSVPEAHFLPPLSELLQYEAVRLFTERASAAKADFALTPLNASAVVQICQRLDGIPLAIELATARIKVLPAEQIAEHLDDRFRLLTDGTRTALPRHRTLRAIIDWDYELLSEEERAMFRRLSIFSGGWTLEAAEFVCGGVGVWESDISLSHSHASRPILDLLAHLVDKSLVVAEERNGEARYRMLETLLQYGVNRLSEAGEVETYRHRHALYFAELAEKAEPGLKMTEVSVWIERLESEHANLRAAIEWSLNHELPETSLRFAGAMGIFWRKRGYLREGRTWLERLLAQTQDALPQLRVKAMVPLGWLVRDLGDYAQAIKLQEESLGIFRSMANQRGIVDVLIQRGILAVYQNDLTRAFACFDESLTLSKELDYRRERALALVYLGHAALFNLQWDAQAKSRCEEALAIFKVVDDQTEQAHAHIILGAGSHFEGDDDRAGTHLEAATQLCRQAGDKRQLGWSSVAFGQIMRWQGRQVEALSMAKEALRLALELEEKTMTVNALIFVALSAKDRGQLEHAAHLLSCALGRGESFGFRPTPHMWVSIDPCVDDLRAALGEDAYSQASAEGRTMKWEEAIELALNI